MPISNFLADAREKLAEWRKRDKSTHKVNVESLDKDAFSWRSFSAFIGPGVLVSIAYLDPGNLLSDILSGAQYNYTLLWVLWAATVLALLVQILSARLGIVTGRHLALMCRKEYGTRTPLTIVLWILSEITIVASDIPEVVGTAFGLLLLFGIPLWGGVIMVSASTFLLLGVQYFGVRYLEALIALLISLIACSFIAEAAMSPIAWTDPNCPNNQQWDLLLNCTGVAFCPENYCGSVWEGFIPRISLDPGMLMIATSLIGAVVMPHNLYLHSALVLSRKVDRTQPVQVKWANIYTTIECAVSLLVAVIINTTVITVSASVFFPNASNNYFVAPNLDSIGFTDANQLLADTLGSKWAGIMFGLALLASGQSSTITGTYAGQFVMQGFLDLKLVLWKRNIITRAFAIVPSLVVCLVAGTEGANTLIIISSVILSFQLPFVLIPLLKFTSSRSIMGNHVNSKLMVTVCTLLSGLVVATNMFLVGNTVVSSLHGMGMGLTIAIVAVLAAIYLSFLGYLAWRPVRTVLDGDDEDTECSATEVTTCTIADNKDMAVGTLTDTEAAAGMKGHITGMDISDALHERNEIRVA